MSEFAESRLSIIGADGETYALEYQVGPDGTLIVPARQIVSAIISSDRPLHELVLQVKPEEETLNDREYIFIANRSIRIGRHRSDVSVLGRSVSMGEKPFSLLRYLGESRDEIQPYHEIYMSVWDRPWPEDAEGQIKRKRDISRNVGILRNKFDDVELSHSWTGAIRNVIGVGYVAVSSL